jgi:hypothetical protein
MRGSARKVESVIASYSSEICGRSEALKGYMVRELLRVNAQVHINHACE